MAPADFQPVVKKSVCYIVAAVLFNEKNEVSLRGDLVDDCQSQNVRESLCENEGTRTMGRYEGC